MQSSNHAQSDSMRMEKALRLTQLTMDSAAGAIFWIRQDGSYFYANTTALGLPGYSIAELLRMKTYDINPAHCQLKEKINTLEKRIKEGS